MAYINDEMDVNGSILDSIAHQLVGQEDDDEIQNQDEVENNVEQNSCSQANQDANENTEFNLKAVLTMHVDEFKHADHDFYNYEPECYTSSVPNQEIEVLFCRDDLKSRLEKRKLSSHQSPSLPDSCQVDEQNDTQFDDQHTATSTSNKGLQPHSSLTQNVNYKSFMEETMFIKCCSKEVLQLLENIKNVVGQKIGIRNDSSFGHVLTVQAWIWILKETALISSLATKNDKTRHKSMNCFMSKIFSTIDGSFKQLHSEMRNLLKIYEKVESEFKSLNEKSQHRFENNVAGASEYERNTSGCSFFQHHYSQYDSNESSFVDFGMVSTKSLMKKPQKTLSEGVTSRGMKVRWNVDGVTVRSTETGCKWLKFLSVNQDKDKIIIMKIFANALSEAYHDGRKYKVIARKILHRSHHLEHIFSKGSLTPSSILESVFKCKSILDKSRKAINLLPKEEVIMLYSLKSAMAAFSLIKPTLIDAILATEELNKICSELSSQRKKLQSGDIGSRIPLERHAYFEMEIEDTKINVDIMLSRYPNIYDAKSMRDKLLQRSRSHQTNDTNSEDAFIDDVPLETIYNCPTNTLATQSTQELVESVRTSITDIQSNPINPACYLFNDLELEYKGSIETLTNTREVSPCMLSLCSDRIRDFNVIAKELASSSDMVQKNLAYAITNLNCTESESFGEIENSFWFQLIYKSVQIWDFHSLPKHLKTHFHSITEKSMSWIEKLETTFGQYAQQVNTFKQEFLEYHDNLEINQGIRTCIWRKPNRSRYYGFGYKQEGEEEPSSMESFQSPTPSQPILLNFTDFDMDLIQMNPNDTRTILLSFNKCSSNVQIALVAILFSRVDEVCSRALVNLNRALQIHERELQIKKIKQLIPTDKRISMFRHLHQLENLVLAVTVEGIHEKLRETIDSIGKLDNAISQFNRLFQMVQLQLEDRGIINTTVKKGGSSSQAKQLSKRELQLQKEHQDHDFYLSETIQLFRNSVNAMPNSFEIRDESLKNAYLQWVKLAEKDQRLVETMNNNPHVSGRETIINPQEIKAEVESGKEVHVEKSQNDIEDSLPIDFEEAMMLTTTGKAFFPDPVLFTSNIEGWRSMCFKMLAEAINKFRQMIMTKIIRTKMALIWPLVSKPHSESESELTTASPFSKGERLSVSVPSTENTSTKSSSHKIGLAEGLCSLIGFIALQLNRRDRVFVASDDMKQLKNKYYAVRSLVDKFKRELDSVENSLINSLSLTMASVEYKNLPRDLEIPLNDDDFLKSHDLEEIGSKEEQLEFLTQKELQTSENDDDEKAEEDFIELYWSASNRKKLFCREESSSSWLNFSLLQINAQLRLTHMLIDELIQVFQKARSQMKESKNDLMCAKKLLEKTWQGIGKDLKRGRIPDSGILVLVKLYRHQIATAVMNTKAIRKMTREVQYLLSQSVHNTRFWADELTTTTSQGRNVGRNRVLNLDNLTLTIKLKSHVAPESWLMIDEEKVSQDEVKNDLHPISKAHLRLDPENVTEIKTAVQMKSSTSLDIPEDVTSGLSELGMAVTQNPTTKLGLQDKSTPLVKTTDFFNTVSDVERLILSGLDQSNVILKMPDCSISPLLSESDMVPNITGLLTATADVTMHIRQFKEIPPLIRSILTDRISELERKINKVGGPDGLADSITTRLAKLKKDVVAEDSKFRRKHCSDQEFLKIEEIRVPPPEPVYGITPMEFVEDLAARSSSHVWTLMTGISNIGILIKDNKTLESHSLSDIRLDCQLEVLFSLFNFMEKLVEHVISNLETTQKGIIEAKIKFISQTKMWTGLKRFKWHSSGMAMGKYEVEDYLHGFASIFQICKKGEQLQEEIHDMIRLGHDVVQQIKMYFNLKFRMEPSGTFPTIDNDMLLRSRTWHSVDMITGLANLPEIPPPAILNRKIRQKHKEETIKIKYKTALENKSLELEVYFDILCKNPIAVELPIRLAPIGGMGEVVDNE